MKEKTLISISSMLCGLALGWLFWFPIRLWCFSQIPPDVEWAGIAKILIVVIVGWCGGVALPFIFLLVALIVFLKT